MSVVTRQEDGQPLDAEELIRNLGDVPDVSPELRSRVLIAASQAASEAKRQRGWVIAAAFATTCAAGVLAVAFFGPGQSADVAPVTNRTPNEFVQPNDAVNKTLIDPDDVLSSSVLP